MVRPNRVEGGTSGWVRQSAPIFPARLPTSARAAAHAGAIAPHVPELHTAHRAPCTAHRAISSHPSHLSLCSSHWIDAYANADATEVMHAFHSEHAKAMQTRLPRSKSPPDGIPPPVASTYAFRELRQRLEREGWFKISALGEAQKLIPWFVMTAAGITCTRMSGGLARLGAVICLGVGNTLAGWLAHDFVHSRSRFAAVVRPFSELVGGMSQTWWSMKHNMHHALTNEIG